jgi:hypothetical protein
VRAVPRAHARSVAQEADAVVKLFQCGLLPQSYALGKLGYSDDEISAIKAAARGRQKMTVLS